MTTAPRSPTPTSRSPRIQPGDGARKSRATLKQIEANRANAQLSTGPRTDAGKAVSRMNAMKHGLLARTAVLPHVERHEDWKNHHDVLR